jgi:hypothetical protein
MSKKLHTIEPDEPGLTTTYGGNYTANAFAIQDQETGEVVYQITYHKDDMPAFNGQTFKTREELEAAMRLVTPEVRELLDDMAQYPQNDKERLAVLRALARQLMAETGCPQPSARQKIAQAMRRRRGEIVAADNRGGNRPGAGRPRTN